MKRIVSFVIVGVILTIGLIGTVYVLKQHGEQVRKEQAIAAYDKQQADQKNTETADKSTVVNTGDIGESNDSTSGNAQELPTTGSNFAVSELFGVGLLAAVIVGYQASRRNLARSL